MAKSRILINKHNIRHNLKNEDKKPVISVQQGKKITYGKGVFIDGPCAIMYNPDHPLKCGATVWIETEAKVNIS